MSYHGDVSFIATSASIKAIFKKKKNLEEVQVLAFQCNKGKP